MSTRKIGKTPWNKSANGMLISNTSKLKNKLRHQLRKAVFKKLITPDFKDYIGCDVNTLRAFIESQFKDGMTWDNYGEWHLDHCVPLACFNLFDDVQQKLACNYKNIQPLMAHSNLSKQSKRTLYVICGVSGSGKSWICSQLPDYFDVYDFDKGMPKTINVYRPVCAITVGVSTFIKNNPQFNTKLIIVNEDEDTIRKRLTKRGGFFTDHIARRMIRMSTLHKKATFVGTSEQVLQYFLTQAVF